MDKIEIAEDMDKIETKDKIKRSSFFFSPCSSRLSITSKKSISKRWKKIKYFFFTTRNRENKNFIYPKNI